MNRFAILALLATACSAGIPQYELAPHTLWLEPGQAGYAEQAQWGLPLPADFAVEILPTQRDTAEACGWEESDGCAVAGTVRVNGAQFAERQSAIILHEMGHLFGAEHVDDVDACPDHAFGAYVMCAWGTRTPVLQLRDFETISLQ